jgi:putative transposase
MPRVRRSVLSGAWYHVLNRGNERQRLFFEAADYKAFLAVLRSTSIDKAMDLLAYCVMPNHWHLVVKPGDTDALSAYMHDLTGTHALRWRRHHRSTSPGHVYQGRFKSFPIVSGQHLLAVLRYVEANPVRAGLTKDAGAWRWSSHTKHACAEAPSLASWPWAKPSNWSAQLNGCQSDEQLTMIRNAVVRGVPLDTAPPLSALPVLADSASAEILQSVLF